MKGKRCTSGCIMPIKSSHILPNVHMVVSFTWTLESVIISIESGNNNSAGFCECANSMIGEWTRREMSV